MYRQLKAGRITETARQLSQRIGERFPDSGLSRVSVELCGIAEASEQRSDRLGRPHWPVRVSTGVALAAILGVAATTGLSMPVQGGLTTFSEFVQAVEAVINDVIFLGIAVFFLLTLESRLKRRIALRAMDDLRSIAHIIDMHQLTKDPAYVIEPRATTASSPRRAMTRAELTRYLDYCSELLSLTSKLAALHVQSFSEPVVLDAVNGIEALTVGLSAKIWQKIMILDLIAATADRR